MRTERTVAELLADDEAAEAARHQHHLHDTGLRCASK